MFVVQQAHQSRTGQSLREQKLTRENETLRERVRVCIEWCSSPSHTHTRTRTHTRTCSHTYRITQKIYSVMWLAWIVSLENEELDFYFLSWFPIPRNRFLMKTYGWLKEISQASDVSQKQFYFIYLRGVGVDRSSGFLTKALRMKSNLREKAKPCYY